MTWVQSQDRSLIRVASVHQSVETQKTQDLLIQWSFYKKENYHMKRIFVREATWAPAFVSLDTAGETHSFSAVNGKCFQRFKASASSC